jgi:hypothetical protein
MTFAQGDRPPRLALRNRPETGRPRGMPDGRTQSALLGLDLLPSQEQTIENIEENTAIEWQAKSLEGPF